MKNLWSEFHHRTNLTALLFSNLGSRNKTMFSEIWNSGSKGYPFCKGFWDFVKEQFSWLENGFIVFRRKILDKKSVVRFILGWVFLNKISNLCLALGSYMGNSAKSLFCSVFVNKFHHRTKLLALLHLKDNYVFRILKFWVLRVPPIQIPTQNGKMKILKFINLKVSYIFRILNAILNWLVCNMMKLFTHPTSAWDFLSVAFWESGKWVFLKVFRFWWNFQGLYILSPLKRIRCPFFDKKSQ
jgi:hypothetical protein